MTRLLVLIATFAACSPRTEPPPAGPPSAEAPPDTTDRLVGTADDMPARAESETVTVHGLIETGFERSAFRPCDGSGEDWWLTPSPAVANRMFALQREHTTGDEGRGLRLVYGATLSGDVRRGDVYGHLGEYVAEFEAREAVALEVLAVNPETPVACPAP